MGRKRKCDLEDDESGDVKLPYQRNAANERERDRMRVLSKAFSKLKTTLPWVPSDTKLSKLDTLRLATCYIAHLRQILAEDEGEIMPEPSIPCRTNTQPNVTVHPLNLTWPYSFTGKFPSLEGGIALSPCSQGCDIKITHCNQGNDVKVSQQHYSQGCDVKLSRDLINGSS